MRDLLNLKYKFFKISLPMDAQQHIAENLRRTDKRLEMGEYGRGSCPIAICGFGPSLKDFVDEIKTFPGPVMTTSGAHDFIGRIPDYHVGCDPKQHQVSFTQSPNKETQYLMASSVHPDVIDKLIDYNLCLWNLEVRPLYPLPDEEFELHTYGDVGQQAIYIAHAILGYKDVHLFGFDYAFGPDEEQHAGYHGDESTEREEFKVGNRVWVSHLSFIKHLLLFNKLIADYPTLTLTIHGDTLLANYLEAKYVHNS